MIIVHRGNQAFRQNSLMAVLTALDKAHMSIVEFDIYWTDGRWVLAHDSTKVACAEDLSVVISMVEPRLRSTSSPRLLIDIKWDKPIDQELSVAMNALTAALSSLSPSSFMLQFPSIKTFRSMNGGGYITGLLVPSPVMVDWTLLPKEARFVMIDMNAFTLDDIDEIREMRPDIKVFVYTCKGVSQYLYFRQAVDAVVCDIVW